MARFNRNIITQADIANFVAATPGGGYLQLSMKLLRHTAPLPLSLPLPAPAPRRDQRPRRSQLRTIFSRS